MTIQDDKHIAEPTHKLTMAARSVVLGVRDLEQDIRSIDPVDIHDLQLAHTRLGRLLDLAQRRAA